jgi:glucosamine 6-phosphate synthetase-like amidotransferase/phosphosugar isomerase protein
MRDVISEMSRQGHSFRSQTDSEVVAHLIGQEYERLVAQLLAIVQSLEPLGRE